MKKRSFMEGALFVPDGLGSTFTRWTPRHLLPERRFRLVGLVLGLDIYSVRGGTSKLHPEALQVGHMVHKPAVRANGVLSLRPGVNRCVCGGSPWLHFALSL